MGPDLREGLRRLTRRPGFTFLAAGTLALGLSTSALSDEDILLERRQLGTDFEYSIDFGLSFTLGSLFNNVVSPRMSRGGGRRFRFF